MKRAVETGLRAVYANIAPMTVLWLAAVACVCGYYFVPGVKETMEPLARFQTAGGWWAAFINRFFFCGVVPGVFIVTVKAIRTKRPLAVAFTQGVWGGISGVVYDGFYTLQSWVFGNGADPLTLLCKTLVDQFVMTPLLVAPLNVVVFFWIAHGFAFDAFRREFPRPFIRVALMPNLVTNWFVWIPVVIALYCFPVALQVQLSGFACALWALICLEIGRRSSSSRNVS